MKLCNYIIVAAIALLTVNCTYQEKSKKPRIIISTDVGGTDPDDNQSVVHLLMYSDLFDIEGLVSSPSYGNGSKEEILRMIDLYEKDLPLLEKHKEGFLSPEYLRSICKQGKKGAAPYCGYSTATEGSEWIVHCARQESDRPLWVLVWGGLDDVAQALHDAPDIADKIRIYWIGGPNKKWSVNSYVYIVENFPDLWFIENNASYRGFIGNQRKADKYNRDYYDTYIAGAGNLGADYINYYKGQSKLGDTPSLLYLMHGDPENPEGESWGGRFTPMTHSPRVVFDHPLTVQDTAQVFSIMEFRLKGPKLDLPADSVCLTLTIRKQEWPGYYVGDGVYVVRHTTYYLGTIPYTIVSHIDGLDDQEGEFTVENVWPGRKRVTDYRVGNTWYTDIDDAELMEKNVLGSKTTSKWRNEIMEDWGIRWSWLKQ